MGLPIEVRTPDFELLKRATLGNALRAVSGLKEGKYVLSVSLPTGVKVGHEVSIGPDGGVNVEHLCSELAKLPTIGPFIAGHISTILDALQHDESEGRTAQELKSSPEWPVSEVLASIKSFHPGTIELKAASSTAGTAPTWVSSHNVGAIAGTMDPASSKKSDARKQPLAAARILDGTGLKPGRGAARPIRIVDGTISVRREVDGPPSTLQVLVADLPALNFVVPRGATLSGNINADGSVVVRMSTGVSVVDDILARRADGQVDEVFAVLHALGTPEVVRFAPTSPAASLAIGYGLLRSATMTEVAQTAGELSRLLPREPDAMVIAAEVAARLGNHKDALDGFLESLPIGLPSFSVGINYVVDRLRFYTRTTTKKTRVSKIDPDHNEKIDPASAKRIQRIQEFAIYMDFNIALVSYSGLDISSPDGDPVERHTVEKVLASSH
jgi:hypothetical protein